VDSTTRLKALGLPLCRRERSADPRSAIQAPEERALIAFLDRHFPERRRKPRDED
jgi:hypothetical protein